MAQKKIIVKTQGQGLYTITSQVLEAVRGGLPTEGLLHIFLLHTSASLLIQENFDPTAREDLEEFMKRLVPEDQKWHRHTAEGPDDTTSHLKGALTPTFLVLPVANHQLALGRWQGIYLWEHRYGEHERQLLLTIVDSGGP